MPYTLLPNEGTSIPHETLKQITDQPEFANLPFARLIIHLQTNLTRNCRIILNNSLIKSPYKTPNPKPNKKFPPRDKPIGANRNDIWIPRSVLNTNTGPPWRITVVPAPVEPPQRPTTAQLIARPSPIPPTTPMYAYPLLNPDVDLNRRREQAEQLEKDVLVHWEFLEKQIEIKLNQIFFGNKDGSGDDWQKLSLRLPSPSQPNNTQADKLYKLKKKPSFKGQGGSNWKTFTGTEKYNPITIPSDYVPPVAIGGSYLSDLIAAGPNLPTPMPQQPDGINPHSKVRPFKFFIYPIYRRFHRMRHPQPPPGGGPHPKPYWPPLCYIAPGGIAPPPPLSAVPLPPYPPILAGVGGDGRANILTAGAGFQQEELHININIKLDVKEVKLKPGENMESKMEALKKIPNNPPPKGVNAKTKSFCNNNLGNLVDVTKEITGTTPGKNTIDATKQRRRKSERDHQNLVTAPAAIQRERAAFARGIWQCGGKRKKTQRKKNKRKNKTIKRKKQRGGRKKQKGGKKKQKGGKTFAEIMKNNFNLGDAFDKI